MKILIVNSILSQGGAARAAFRLHQGLLGRQVDSLYLTRYKDIPDKTVIASESRLARLGSDLLYRLDRLLLKGYHRFYGTFSSAWFPVNTHRRINDIKADLVHLHWVAYGFLNIDSIYKINKPIVWTLHDSWVFTGGCHVPFQCKNYQDSCGTCPLLSSKSPRDLSSWVLSKKRRVWKDFVVVAPSRWLAECARSSSLLRDFRIEVIPNGIDTKFWRPMDKALAREKLSLPKDRKLVLLLANCLLEDPNKGFPLFREAMQFLDEKMRRDIVVVLVGASRPVEDYAMSCDTINLGQIDNDEMLRLIYSAVDVAVVPSLQENLPYSVMEPMSCATPVVAFKIGGIPDMIEHEKNGYLVEPYLKEHLSQGIEWLLGKEGLSGQLGLEARKTIEKDFDIDMVVLKHIDLYNKILSK